MKPKLSICITVYNQMQLLRWNLENIVQYKDESIQIVVSDNCSSDPIKDIVESFGDERIKYCKTDSNVGQDGNILNALKNCDSNYAFLLRTRDTILTDHIPQIIRTIANNQSVAYMRFSSVGENNEIRLGFSDTVYCCGKESLKADYGIPIHPSGELYNLSYISYDELDFLSSFLCERFPNNNGFLAHVLLRHYLVPRGSFLTSSCIVWYYANTSKASDLAVVNEKEEVKRYSPYSPRYQYPRYESEVEYVLQKVPNEFQIPMIKGIIKKYAEFLTVFFDSINNSQGIRNHYHCQKEDYSPKKEKRAFLLFSKQHFAFCNPRTRRMIRKYSVFCVSIYLPLKKIKRRIMHQPYAD